MKMCGNCDYTDGLTYTASNPQVKCSITGGFYSPDEPCPILNPQKQKENQAFWIGYNAEKKTAICSRCNRLDHVDPLATHCRYCGASIRRMPKKQKKIINNWKPFNSPKSYLISTIMCPKCKKHSYIPAGNPTPYTFCPWCGEKVVEEEIVYE